MVKELFELMPTKYGRYDEVEMLPVMKENGTKFVIYGAGQGGKFLLAWMKRVYKMVPDFIVDRQFAADTVDGVPVISCDEFKGLMLKDRFLVMIAVLAYYEDKRVRDEIDEVLREAGKHAEYITCPADKIFETYDLCWYHYIKERKKLFERTYEWLIDSISKETMECYLRTIILGEKYSGVTFPEQYKYWGMDSDEEALFQLYDKEVLLNIGAARGDTVYQFLKCCKSYKKIITVEASKHEYEKLKQNLGFLSKENIEKIQADHYFLGKDGRTIDSLYGNEDISLINMDIEGAELSVLKTAVNTIQKNRPVLSVCAYHKVEDLVEIPAWISENVEDYVFALRKYPCAWFVDRVQTLDIPELVLYAIPKERFES